MQMSAKLGELARTVGRSSQWESLAGEAEMTWDEAKELTLPVFTARLVVVRTRGLRLQPVRRS
jgi:hypothetical protein